MDTFCSRTPHACVRCSPCSTIWRRPRRRRGAASSLHRGRSCANLEGVTRAAVAAAVIVALASAAARADRLAEIRARGRLIVSVKNDAKHAHKDPAHFDKRGFELELAGLLAKQLVGDEHKLEPRMLARPLRLPMLAAGSVDLVLSMIPVTPQNAAQVDFSHPYFASGLTLLVRAGAARLTLAQLAGKTVAFRKQSFNDYGGELQRIAREH